MDYNHFLKSNCLKVTKGRLAILEVLTSSEKSITAEAVFEECKKKNIRINLSTIYRCLESFEEKGMVDKFSLKDGVCSYKLKGEEHKHLLRCSICHKEIEVACPLKQVEEIVQNETGFTVTDHNLVMEGICENCKNKNQD